MNAASDPYYTGPVCYQDGWHWTVVQGPDGYEQPGEKLHLEDTADGSECRYRLATEADEWSWHERKHGAFAAITLESGEPGLTVTADELERIKELLGR